MSQFFFYPPSGAAGASSPFSGATGDPVPPQAAYVGGIDDSGDLQGLHVDAQGNAQVDVLSSALPAGAATEAKQDAEIVLLDNISDSVVLQGSSASGIAQVIAGVDSIGNVQIPLVNAGSMSVAVTSSTLPTGAATAALQTTGNASLASIDAGIPAALGQSTMANSMRVVLASDQSTVPVSMAAVPTGGSTAALQTTGNNSLASIDTKLSSQATAANQTTGNSSLSSIDTKTPTVGQKAMAASSPVVIASDQSALLNKATSTTLSGSTTGPALSDIIASTDVSDYKMLSLQISTSGSLSGSATVQVLGSNDGITFSVAQCVDATSSFGTFYYPYVPAISGGASAPGLYKCSIYFKYLKVQLRTYSGSGTITATAFLSAADGTDIPTVQPFVSLSDNLGNTVRGSQTVAISDSAGTDFTLGQKTMTASLPVTLASNQSALATTAQSPSPITFVRNDYTSVAVTTAAYTQLIASTSAAISIIEIFDSSGQTLKIAFGGAGSEVDKFLVFPGGNGRITCAIPASTRVSIKAVSANATAGELDINFYG